MVTQFQALPLQGDAERSGRSFAAHSQHEFPITDDLGKVHGILTRDDMIAALRKSGPATPIADVMRADIPALSESMLFDRAFALMQECRCPLPASHRFLPPQLPRAVEPGFLSLHYFFSFLGI